MDCLAWGWLAVLLSRTGCDVDTVFICRFWSRFYGTVSALEQERHGEQESNRDAIYVHKPGAFRLVRLWIRVITTALHACIGELPWSAPLYCMQDPGAIRLRPG